MVKCAPAARGGPLRGRRRRNSPPRDERVGRRNGHHGRPALRQLPPNLRRSGPGEPRSGDRSDGQRPGTRSGLTSKIVWLAHSGLCSGEARAGHPEGRAGDVVEARFVEEGNALRVAAVLPANPELQVWVRLLPPLAGHLDQLAHTVLIESLEGVVLQQAALQVLGEELLLGVVAAYAADHLRQVVGAEGEEIGGARYLACHRARPRQLNHRPDGQAFSGELHLDQVPHLPQLRREADERYHYLDVRLAPALPEGLCSLSYGAGLHQVDVGTQEPEPAAPKPQHRVSLFETLRYAQLPSQFSGVLRPPLAFGYLLGQVLRVGEELVQQRVQKTHGHRQTVHGREVALEVLSLHGVELD